MRSDAAAACCRLAFTRLSFLTGPYINSSAATNDVNSPGASAALRQSRGCRTTARRRSASPPTNSIIGGSTDSTPVTFRFVRYKRAATHARTSPPRAPRRRTP